MNQFSTRSISLLPIGGVAYWRSALMAALLIGVFLLNGAHPTAAQEANGAITGLTLSSDTPRTLVVSWDIPSPAPSDYRVDWAKSGENYQSYTVSEGHIYPEGTATTVTVHRPGGRRRVQGTRPGALQ